MRSLPRAAFCALLAMLMLTVAGCGGDSSSSSGNKDPELASKSPQAILDAMQADLQDVRGYHVEGTSTDKDGRARLAGDVSAKGDLTFEMVNGAQKVNLVAVGGQTYLRGNKAFWDDSAGGNPKVVALLTGKWVKAPASAGGDLKSGLAQFSPDNLGYCLSTQTGTVSKRGTAEVGGKPVVVLEDKGDKPGTAPGRLSVAASGPTLPVRLMQTGPKQSGGKPDPRCGDGDDDTKRSDVRFSGFGDAVRIQAPRDALDLEALQNGGSATTS